MHMLTLELQLIAAKAVTILWYRSKAPIIIRELYHLFILGNIEILCRMCPRKVGSILADISEYISSQMYFL